MKERPKCAVEKCENKAFIFYAGEWICGKCLLKVMEKMNKMKMEMLNAD